MKVATHGNCQSWMFAALIKEAFPDWHVREWQVHQIDLARDIEAYKEYIRTADIVLHQPVSRSYRSVELSSDWLRESVKASAICLSYPVIYFQGYHPTLYWTYAKGRQLAGYMTGQLDIYMIKRYLEGADVREAIAEILSDNFMSDAQIKRLVDCSLNSLRQRELDAKIDLPVSGIIEDNFFAGQLFSTTNNPKRALTSIVANEFFHKIGYNAVVRGEGLDYLSISHLPALPCISRQFIQVSGSATRLQGEDYGLFKLDGKYIEQRQYYEAMFRHLATFDRADLSAALEGEAEGLNLITDAVPALLSNSS